MNHTKLQEITSFTPPGGFKSYKAPRKAKNDFWARLLFVLALGLILLFAWSVANPPTATAKTIELKDCMTNECIIKLYCEGNTGYVQESALDKLCDQAISTIEGRIK